jgi:hypothetical protein
MKRYTYLFSLVNRDKEIPVDGTAVVYKTGYFTVMDKDAEVAVYIQKEVQGYRRAELK